MDSITKMIKAEIKRQYKSVRQFSEKSGIPYSTLSNALAKGIGGTSYETVNKMLHLLHLQPVTDEVYELHAMLAALDEHAAHAVRSVLHAEYDRCTNRTAMATA